MTRRKLRKKENQKDDDSNRFAILLILINSDKPLSLSEISKNLDLPTNLIFYHLKSLKKEHIILENEDKRYTCQPFFKDEDLIDDIDALLLMIIKIFSRNIEIDRPTEKHLFRAVMDNLRIYLDIFEVEGE